jgi:hypothetical protein
MKLQAKVTRSKYGSENMLPALRHFILARNEALAKSLITDNGGAIHSIERILDILSLRVCYPHVSHYNSLKTCPDAHRSTAAHYARMRGEKIEIEHVLPKRAYAQAICLMVEEGATDAELLDYIRDNFRLVLLTKEERTTLDRINRSRLSKARLAEAGIAMLHYD